MVPLLTSIFLTVNLCEVIFNVPARVRLLHIFAVFVELTVSDPRIVTLSLVAGAKPPAQVVPVDQAPPPVPLETIVGGTSSKTIESTKMEFVISKRPPSIP